MKKVKLFLSLCMMCLSIAVLCMGILAANSATYNITGNMSYNMIDGVALVNTRVYKVAGTESDLSTKCTELSSKSFEEIERDTSTYYILSQKLDSQPLINTSSGETSSSKTTSVDIVYGAVDSGVVYYTYYVVIQIRNMSTDKSYVLNAYLETVTTPTKSNVVVNATSDNVVWITSGSYSNVIVALTYTGTSTDKDEDSFSYDLTVKHVDEWVEKTFSGTYYSTTYSRTLKVWEGMTWSFIFAGDETGDLRIIDDYVGIAWNFESSAGIASVTTYLVYGTGSDASSSSTKVKPSEIYDSSKSYGMYVYHVGHTGGGSK